MSNIGTIIRIGISAEQMKFKFLASYQPPRAKTVPLAETSTIQANPSAAALTPARPAAEPVRTHANSRTRQASGQQQVQNDHDGNFLPVNRLIFLREQESHTQVNNQPKHVNCTRTVFNTILKKT